MKVECDYCGKIFNKRKDIIEKTKHNFCCPRHYQKYRQKIGLPQGIFKKTRS